MKFYMISLMMLLMTIFIECDLPVHCLKHEVSQNYLTIDSR